VEPLIQALKDENEHLRYDAAYLLCDIGNKRAVEALQVMRDKDKSLKCKLMASEALKKIKRKKN